MPERISKSILQISVAALIALSVYSGVADAQDDLQKQVADLREGQKAILHQLEVIKALLQGDRSRNLVVSVEGFPFAGTTSAPVAVEEFSDFQCSYCGSFFNAVYPALYNDYIKTGKVIWFFRDFPLDALHPAAFKAAEAAHCAAEQGKYEEMHERLFTNQQTLDIRWLPAHAAALRLNPTDFAKCLDGGKYAERVRSDISAGKELGIMGTPSFLLGRFDSANSTVNIATRLDGMQTYTQFKGALDKLLQRE